MTTTHTQKTNIKGIVIFENRNYSYRGDKGTWARFWVDSDGSKKLTVMRARHGIVSEAYENELEAFCQGYGFAFSGYGEGIGAGEKKTVTI